MSSTAVSPSTLTRSAAAPGADATPPAGAARIAVLGAGPVGMTTALLLAQCAGVARIDLVDARSPVQQQADPRVIALSFGSRLILQRAGAWPVPDASPIRHIHVSQQGWFGRTRIEAAEFGVDALGHVARYGAIARALSLALDRQPSISARHGLRVEHVEASADGQQASVVLSDGQRADYDWVICAEGGVFSETLSEQGRQTRTYAQQALIAEVRLNDGRPDTAWERFTRQGPCALLPLGNRRALVWCGDSASTQRRLALAPETFCAELAEVFGQRFLLPAVPASGHIPTGRTASGCALELIGERHVYPLGLAWRPDVVEGPMIAIGNAAQMLHPVAGQGMNLGLRDALDLADAWRMEGGDARRASSRHAARRRLDRQVIMQTTDRLARGFATPGALQPAGGSLALALLDMLPDARGAFGRLMMLGPRGL